MEGEVKVYRFSRRLSLLIFIVAVIFFAMPFLPNDRHMLPLGYLLMAAVPMIISAIGAVVWKYGIYVDGSTIGVGAFTRRRYALCKATSIDVQMTKAGRVATIKFSDGQSLSFGSNLVDFDGLLTLISQRSSLPVTKPVWDP
jgi:hypothetical protein